MCKHCVCMYVCMYVYNISGGATNIFYPSCAQIDNNQQVYEVQIILKLPKGCCESTERYDSINVKVQ
jgi:hypothetical protein